MKRKLVYLEWIDAVAPTDCSWLCGDDVKEYTGRELLIKDCGWIVDESKDYLSIVAGLSEEQEDSQWESIFHRLIRIPIKCIKRRKDLSRHIV